MYWNLNVELNEQYFHAIHSRFTILPYVDKQHFEEKRFFAEETTYLLATYYIYMIMSNEKQHFVKKNYDNVQWETTLCKQKKDSS